MCQNSIVESMFNVYQYRILEFKGPKAAAVYLGPLFIHIP